MSAVDSPAAIDHRIADAEIEEARARARAARAENEISRYGLTERRAAERTAAYELCATTTAAADDVRSLYAGWSRFFLVQDGHIHRSMRCSTCYISTSFSWLPDLSGMTEAEAVAEYGGILCSVCYPSAPVEWTTGENRKDAERKDAERRLRELVKSPEGKAVVTAAELVRRKNYTLGRLLGDIARHDATAAIDPDDVPQHMVAARDRAEAELPKITKQYDRAVAKLEAAEARLQEALS